MPCLALPCLALPCLALHCIALHCIALLHTITYHYIPLHTITYHCIPLHTITYHYIPLHTIIYHYIPLHTITYIYIPLHTFTCHYIPLHTITYHYIPLHTITYHTIPYRTVPYHTIQTSYYIISLANNKRLNVHVLSISATNLTATPASTAAAVRAGLAMVRTVLFRTADRREKATRRGQTKFAGASCLKQQEQGKFSQLKQCQIQVRHGQTP